MKRIIPNWPIAVNIPLIIATGRLSGEAGKAGVPDRGEQVLLAWTGDQLSSALCLFKASDCRRDLTLRVDLFLSA